MPTPIFHSFTGLLFFWNAKKENSGKPLYRWGQLLGFLVLANLPDLDLIPRLFLGIPVAHGIFTHSLLFACIIAVLVGSWQRRRLSFSLIPFLVIVCHLGLDFFTGPRLGFHASWGVPWFYPFYGERFSSPVTLFLGTRKKTLGELVCWQNLAAILEDLCLVGLILALWRPWSRQVRPQPAPLFWKPDQRRHSQEME